LHIDCTRGKRVAKRKSEITFLSGAIMDIMHAARGSPRASSQCAATPPPYSGSFEPLGGRRPRFAAAITSLIVTLESALQAPG
jgi:hypothetical protein